MTKNLFVLLKKKNQNKYFQKINQRIILVKAVLLTGCQLLHLKLKTVEVQSDVKFVYLIIVQNESNKRMRNLSL